MHSSAIILFVAGLGVVLVCIATPVIHADSYIEAMETHLENFKKNDRLYNVVKIRGAKGNGYGLIIARNFNSLFVATARHILHDDFVNDESGPNAALVVRLYGIEEKWQGIPGQIYEPPTVNGVADLAVIEVFVPREPSADGSPYLKSEFWREKVIVNDPRPGALVELAATVDDIKYAGGSGRIVQVENVRTVRINGLEGERGQSGAPVATDRGFIGLYLGSGTQQVILLPDIRDAIINEYGAPFWQLLSVDPRPTPARLCVHVRGARVDEISINGPYGIVKFDNRGCASSATGHHNVFGVNTGLICAPSSFVLTADASGQFTIKCTVDPSGIWSTSGQGYLQLELLRDRMWDLTLNLPLNQGQIRGKVTGSLPVLHLKDGVLAGHTSVFGSIKVESDKLHIDFTTGTEFFGGIYAR